MEDVVWRHAAFLKVAQQGKLKTRRNNKGTVGSSSRHGHCETAAKGNGKRALALALRTGRRG